MYCTSCEKLVSEKSAVRRKFCPYCGRVLHWFGIPEVNLSKPILKAILRRKNFFVKQRLEQIKKFYYKDQKVDLPLIELQDALTINPDNISARFRLALYYIEKKITDKARKELFKVLELDNKNIDAYFQLANICVEEENYTKAIEYCDKILNIEPKNIVAMYNLAVGYYFLGDLEKALHEFRQILMVDPKNEEVKKAIKELVNT